MKNIEAKRKSIVMILMLFLGLVSLILVLNINTWSFSRNDTSVSEQVCKFEGKSYNIGEKVCDEDIPQTCTEEGWGGGRSCSSEFKSCVAGNCIEIVCMATCKEGALITTPGSTYCKCLCGATGDVINPGESCPSPAGSCAAGSGSCDGKSVGTDLGVCVCQRSTGSLCSCVPKGGGDDEGEGDDDDEGGGGDPGGGTGGDPGGGTGGDQGGDPGGAGTQVTFDNTCGERCGLKEGLCKTGFTCVFLGPACVTSHTGGQLSICVPSAAPVGFKYNICAQTYDNTNSYVTKSDGAAFTEATDVTALCAGSEEEGTETGVCGAKDTNGDKRIDIVDFYSFVQRYSSNKTVKCSI